MSDTNIEIHENIYWVWLSNIDSQTHYLFLFYNIAPNKFELLMLHLLYLNNLFIDIKKDILNKNEEKHNKWS